MAGESNDAHARSRTPLPTYRLLLVTICLTLGAAMTAFGAWAVWQGGPLIILFAGPVLLVLGLMIRFQRTRP